jgi:ankyrin repeat protein
MLGNFDIVNYLMVRGCDLNCASPINDMTPLLACILSMQFDLAQKMIKRGANIDKVNKNGKTYLLQCIEQMNMQAVGFLLKNNANPHIEDASG